MAVVHGKNLDHKVVAIALENETKSVDVAIDNDVVEKTAAGDAAKEYLQGVYGWTMDADYNWDALGTSGNDAVIFGILTSGEQNVQVVPGGGTVSSNNPIYKGNAILKSYSVHVPIDGVVAFKAS